MTGTFRHGYVRAEAEAASADLFHGLTIAQVSDTGLWGAWRADPALVASPIVSGDRMGPTDPGIANGEDVVEIKDLSPRFYHQSIARTGNAPSWATAGGTGFVRGLRFTRTNSEQLQWPWSQGAFKFHNGGEFTIVMRLALHTSLATSQALLSCQNTTAVGWSIVAGGSEGDLAMFFHGGTLTTSCGFAWVGFAIDTAYTIAFVSDGADLRGYIDDFSTALDTVALSVKAGDAGGDLTIANRSAGTQYADMTLLGYRMYAYALSQDEIESVDTWIQEGTT